MTAATTHVTGTGPKTGPRAQDGSLAAPALTPRRILAVVDGTERTGHVVEQVKLFSSGERPVAAVLLNIQPTPADGRLRGYGSFKREAIEARLVDDLGRRAVEAAGRVLAHAGIESEYRVEIGDAVETILRAASEEGCDLIFVGQTPPGTSQRWLQRVTGLFLATIAGEVAQLAEVTVVVVK